MQHEIIIKNGTAGVKIGWRFYTHKLDDALARLIDVDTGHYKSVAVAVPALIGGERLHVLRRDTLTQITNPALSWPAGTKVLVRDSDAGYWSERIFVQAYTDFVVCEAKGGGVTLWSQCKLAEGGE